MQKGYEMKGEILSLTSQEAWEFLKPRHYAGRKPQITKAFGWKIDGVLVAVCTFGKPASPPLCRGICGEEHASSVYELNRLCRIEELKEQLSQFVSACLRILSDFNWIVVSYSDTSMHHNGYIYQACNFLYTGLSAKRKDTYQPGGLHPRAYDKSNHSDLFQTRSQKHRYVYLVGDKRTRKRMRAQLKYPVYDHYPKGNEQHYDTANPQIVHAIQIVPRKDGATAS